jgi:uncharacterized protein YutE (UPF0331/DUF86 family)
MADRRISFSNEELPIKEINSYFVTTEKALRSFYQPKNLDFATYTSEELSNELERRIDELDKSTAFTVLAAIEAHLRIDFSQKCAKRKIDLLSKKFRELNEEKGQKLPLDDILEIWRQHISRKSVISELRGALKYRNWLAHGRYWKAKLGQKYDYYSVLILAKNIQMELEIKMGA